VTDLQSIEMVFVVERMEGYFLVDCFSVLFF